jgi:acyl-CoA thioesterase
VSQPGAFRLNVPFIKDLGIEFISSGAGLGVVALNLEARHLNSWAVAHGGVLMSMLDVVMAVAGRTLFAEAGGGVTMEMQTTFLQPAKEKSRLTATGHAYHRSKTMAFCEAEVRDQDARLIAKSTGIFKYQKARGEQNDPAALS